ncbi:MAG TPA: hypothetical protein VMD78_07000 [Candidatus Baltobacteraceae bacterium]|nr:hypothetical protein [Candidatus Baltobacteraceae bacterium]
MPGTDFARLGWLVEKNHFFKVEREYRAECDRGRLRIHPRDSRSVEVVDYAGGGPAELWMIDEVIEGMTSSADWQKATRQPKCPRWDSQAKPDEN